MRQPEYQRIAGEIEKLVALDPAPGTPEAERLEFLVNRQRVHDALADRRTPPPDCEGIVRILEKAFER